jgi:hypothetical protein
MNERMVGTPIRGREFSACGPPRRFFWLFAATLSCLLFTACDLQMPFKPMATAVPLLAGRLLPWSEGTVVEGRRVVLCRSLGDPREGICRLQKKAVTTDSQGQFQFFGLEEGTYFILYDSGLSDFELAMEHWGGQLLYFGDRVWLKEFLGVDLDQENLELHVPEGISFSPHGGWLSSYCALTLSVGRSPFIIAHDMEIAREEHRLRCLVPELVPGQTRWVEFQVASFVENMIEG